MKIYSGIAFGKKLEMVKNLNMGIMISSVYDTGFIKPSLKETFCALDNGAFSDYMKGLQYPFDEYRFLQTLSNCMQYEIPLDFIATPDMVAGGLKSLEFSLKWAERLKGGKLAIVVQNGMKPEDLTNDILDKFTTIFVGGTLSWKWATAKEWAEFAHSNGKNLHIGRAGTVTALQAASEYSDSVDSTSIVRNESWHIIEEFNNQKQLQLAI
jgi:hypothetical protein